MTPTEFAEVMRARHGLRWKRAAARELGRHPITIHKWMKLDELPAHVANHVTLLAEANGRQITSQHQPHGDAE